MVSIAVLDQANGLVSYPYIIEKGERYSVEPQPPVGFRKHVLETREPLLFDAITPELLAEYDQPGAIVGEVPKSSVWVPLVVSGRATGAISLQNVERERAYSEVDLRLLMTLAGSLSVALENARLFEETRQRNAELALINDVQRGLAENLEMQAMYDLVGDRLQQIFDAQVVDIGVLEGDSGSDPLPLHRSSAETSATSRPRRPSGPEPHVLQTLEPIRVDDGGSTNGTPSRRPRSRGEVPKSRVLRSARRRPQGDRRHLAPEPGPGTRFQRGGCPAPRRRSPGT